jgi:hypothetical protein
MATRVFTGQGARGRVWGWAWGQGRKSMALVGGTFTMPIRSKSSAAPTSAGLKSFSLDMPLDDFELPTFTLGDAVAPANPPVQCRGRIGLPNKNQASLPDSLLDARADFPLPFEAPPLASRIPHRQPRWSSSHAEPRWLVRPPRTMRPRSRTGPRPLGTCSTKTSQSRVPSSFGASL